MGRSAPPPATGAFPGTRREQPSILPTSPLEPTIGVDIGVAIPARRLDQDPGASTKATAIVVVAAVAIALVVGLALLVSRLGDADGTPGGSTASESPTAAAAATATSSLPAVPRGIVPDVIGLPSADAAALIRAAGYDVEESREKSPNQSRGNVIDQSPAKGTQLPEGQVVRIQISDGP